MGVPAHSPAADRAAPAPQDFVAEGGHELWFVRWADAAPLGGAGVGLVLALALAGVTRILATLDPLAAGLEARLPYTLSLGIAATVPIAAWAVRRIQEDLDALRTCWLGTPEAFARVRRELRRLPAGLLAATSLAGVATACVAQQLFFGRLSRLLAGDVGIAALWQLALAVTFWAIIFPSVALSVRNALVFGRIGARGIGVALYDAERGLPLARMGIRTLALWLGLPFIIGAIGAVLGAVEVHMLLAMVVAYALGSTFCLLVPTAGLRRRLRRDKEQELERIAEALAGEPDAMRASVLGDEAHGFDRLRLLQWRREVDGFREWPLDAPHLRRFALFVALPLLSWIAAALVERGLDVFLDR